MSRKGVLVSDPSVRKMTRIQWVFEYLALRDREREDKQFQVDAIRRTLIHVMGLSAIIPGNEDPDKFVPLVMLAGNHHLMHGYAKAMGIDGIAEDGSTSVNDTDWEAMSQRMAAGMEPIDDDPFGDVSPQELLNREDKKILGIQEVDELPQHGGDVLDLSKISSQPDKEP